MSCAANSMLYIRNLRFQILFFKRTEIKFQMFFRCHQKQKSINETFFVCGETCTKTPVIGAYLQCMHAPEVHKCHSSFKPPPAGKSWIRPCCACGNFPAVSKMLSHFAFVSNHWFDCHSTCTDAACSKAI